MYVLGYRRRVCCKIFLVQKSYYAYCRYAYDIWSSNGISYGMYYTIESTTKRTNETVWKCMPRPICMYATFRCVKWFISPLTWMVNDKNTAQLPTLIWYGSMILLLLLFCFPKYQRLFVQKLKKKIKTWARNEQIDKYLKRF